MELLRRICAFLEIPFVFTVFSEMGLALGPVEGPGRLGAANLRGARREGVRQPAGRKGPVRSGKVRRQRDPTHHPGASGIRYDVPGYQFEPALSIIEVLMWNSRESVKAYLAGRQGTTARSKGPTRIPLAPPWSGAYSFCRHSQRVDQ